MVFSSKNNLVEKTIFKCKGPSLARLWNIIAGARHGHDDESIIC